MISRQGKPNSSALFFSTDVGGSGTSTDTNGNDELVTTKLNASGSVATLTLNRPPVNSLNLELNEAISRGLRDVRRNHPSARALLLNSSNPRILSAGLDLHVLYDPSSRESLETFWRSFQQVFLDLYSYRLATVAAIEGHAPAGGCMLAMACDHRVMSSDSGTNTIGLSETKLGIAAPYWMARQMVDIVGSRRAERSLGLGLLYNAEEALDVGLVDEVVSSRSEVMPRAVEEAELWAGIPAEARYVGKMLTRGPLVKDLESRREEDVENFCIFVMSDDVQRGLGMYLESLKKRKK